MEILTQKDIDRVKFDFDKTYDEVRELCKKVVLKSEENKND